MSEHTNPPERWYWPMLTWNTAVYYAKAHRPVAGLRALSRVIFLRHFTELCQQCGRPYPLWWDTGGQIWEQIVGQHAGLFCPSCFSELAEEAGLTIRWQPQIFARRAVLGYHHDH